MSQRQGVCSSACIYFFLLGGFFIGGLVACQNKVSDTALNDSSSKFASAAAIRFDSDQPIAVAGDDQLLMMTTVINLDGSQSISPDSRPLNFQWKILQKPIGSQAVLENETLAQTSFQADMMGSYIIQLIVSSNTGTSHPDLVIIAAHANGATACADCHNNQIVAGKSESHLATQDDCGICHGGDVWLPLMGLKHQAIPQQCQQCHDNNVAVGKSATHLLTDLDCNFCHSSEHWSFARWEGIAPFFEHKGIIAGCRECHGQQLPGKPLQHIPSSVLCDNCHTVYSWRTLVKVEHVEVMSECGNCHNGITARGKPITHIETEVGCTHCHISTMWTPAVNPATLTDGCSDCHDNTILAAQPSTHLKTLTQECDECHTLTDWRELKKIEHNRITGECVRCHNGVDGIGVSDNHINASIHCEACHSIFIFGPSWRVDHNETVGDCLDCHDGIIATGQPVNHIETPQTCAACHQTSGWVLS